MTTTTIREPFRFFFDHAGYIVGRRAASAYRRARAERELLLAIDAGTARVVWEDDPESPGWQEGMPEWHAVLVIERACPSCGSFTVAGVLGGVVLDATYLTDIDNLPGDPYARVVRAGVAHEAGFGV